MPANKFHEDKYLVLRSFTLGDTFDSDGSRKQTKKKYLAPPSLTLGDTLDAVGSRKQT